jgi:hypothetical protein
MFHMPLVNKEKPNYHLFLSIKWNSHDQDCYKAEVSVREGNMQHWLKTMVKNVGIEGDITNKSGRVTLITQILAACVPPEGITQRTDHCNLKTLAIYDCIAVLKARAFQ